MCRNTFARKPLMPVAWMAAGVLLLGSVASQAQTPAETSSQPHQARSNARVFSSDAGLVLNFIKPDKTADFEAVVARLREALQKSASPERQQQAAAWRVFRAQEPGANGSVLYVFTMDPAVKGADYAVSAILAEAFPTEAQALYRTYAEAYASGQNYVNLTLTSALGQPFLDERPGPGLGAVVVRGGRQDDDHVSGSHTQPFLFLYFAPAML